MKIRLFLVILFLASISVSYALPGTKQYQAVWNANTESDLAGYYLYHKAVSEEFGDDRRIDCGLETQTLLTGIVPNQSQIALTAYDTSGNESDMSAILFFDLDSSAPGAPAGLQIVPVE